MNTGFDKRKVKMVPIDEVERVWCGFCGACPSECCKTYTMKRASKPHAWRYQLYWKKYRSK